MVLSSQGTKGGSRSHSLSWVSGRLPGGEQEGEGGVGRNKRLSDADNANEKDAAWSFVSFSSEKETEEPWPPPSSSPGDDVSISVHTNN